MTMGSPSLWRRRDLTCIEGCRCAGSTRVLSRPSRGALLQPRISQGSGPDGLEVRSERIVRTVIHEVIADIDQEAAEIVLVVHWIGGVQQRDAFAQTTAWAA
jgi:hypothetical protein